VLNKEYIQMYDISIVLPTIRTHLLEDLYESIVKSCPRHSFELICVGPFDIPDKLMKKDNVKYIKDYGCPSRAIQIAFINTTGKLVHTLVDDCFYYPDVLSETIDLFNEECGNRNILGMKFFESPEHYQAVKEGTTTDQAPEQRNTSHPIGYWYAGPSYGNLKGVNPNWGSACLFIAQTDLVKEFGGWDCKFEYNNHATHDLLFRLQKHDSKFYITEYDVFVANWYEGTTVDHSPIHYGQLTHDVPLFNQMWINPNNRRKIQLDNYKNSPDVWKRRFKDQLPKTYNEMMDDIK